MRKTPSSPVNAAKYFFAMSTFRSPALNLINGIPSSAAHRSIDATNARLIGPICVQEAKRWPRCACQKWAMPALNKDNY